MVGLNNYFYSSGVLFFKICLFVILLFGAIQNLCSQRDSTIVLGSIESELEKQQVPIDLGDTPKTIAAVVGKAIKIHGGLRLSSPRGRFAATFSSQGGNSVKFLSLQVVPKERLQLIHLLKVKFNFPFPRHATEWLKTFLESQVFLAVDFAFFPVYPGKKRSLLQMH